MKELLGEKRMVELRTHEAIIQRTVHCSVPLRNPVINAYSKLPVLDKVKVKLGLTEKPVDQIDFKFCISPITVGNMHRIGCVLKSIPANLIEEKINSGLELDMVADYTESVVYVIAIGIQNNEHEPTEDLISSIRKNFSSEDLYQTFDIVMKQLGLDHFTNTIILVKGVEILRSQKMSPARSEETIASQNKILGESSEATESTSRPRAKRSSGK